MGVLESALPEVLQFYDSALPRDDESSVHH